MKKLLENTQLISWAVFFIVTTIVICYAIKPELLGIHSAFSSLGAFPPTSYIFTTGFIISGILMLIDGINTESRFQKICRYGSSLGIIMLAVFQIEHGEIRGNLHRFGGLIMLLSIMISMIGHLLNEWSSLEIQRRIMYLIFVIFGIVSVVMSILSSAQFKVLELEGLAQYIGLVCLAGWAMMDNKSI